MSLRMTVTTKFGRAVEVTRVDAHVQKQMVKNGCKWFTIVEIFESHLFSILVTGWAVAQTCCISHWSKYRKSGNFDHPWEQNP